MRKNKLVKDEIQKAFGMNPWQVQFSKQLNMFNYFSSSITHELNNITTSINLNGKLLEMELQKRDIDTNDLSEIIRAGERISKLCNSLLVSEQIVGKSSKIDLNKFLLQQEVKICKSLHSGITLSLNLENKINKIKINEGDLIEIIKRLIDTSILLIPNGGEIKIATNSFTASPKLKFVKLSLFVLAGKISSEHIEKLSHPIPNIETENHQNKVGLSKTFSLIQRNKGNLYFKNLQKKGIQIEVYFPF